MWPASISPLKAPNSAFWIWLSNLPLTASWTKLPSLSVTNIEKSIFDPSPLSTENMPSLFPISFAIESSKFSISFASSTNLLSAVNADSASSLTVEISSRIDSTLARILTTDISAFMSEFCLSCSACWAATSFASCFAISASLSALAKFTCAWSAKSCCFNSSGETGSGFNIAAKSAAVSASFCDERANFYAAIAELRALSAEEIAAFLAATAVISWLE